jgi:hypothetical protein
MGFDPKEPEQRRQLREALKAAGITRGELWLNYFSIGGSVGEYEVEAYLQGLLSLPPIQRDLLAMAANELIESVPRLYAPFSDDLTLTDMNLAEAGSDPDADSEPEAPARPDTGAGEGADPGAGEAADAGGDADAGGYTAHDRPVSDGHSDPSGAD